MDNILADALEKLLALECPTEQVRRIEKDPAKSKELWMMLEAAGYPDLLVPESNGGAGESLREIFGILELCGFYAVPVPLAETIIARALLAHSGCTNIPTGSIVIATSSSSTTGKLQCSRVVSGATADWVLLQGYSGAYLLPTCMASIDTSLSPLYCDMIWQPNKPDIIITGVDAKDFLLLQAIFLSCLMAGGIRRIMKKTLIYASERKQFGRSIGEFQAIRHQLSIMAEEASVARMAAQLGCNTSLDAKEPMRIGIAKARTSMAASRIAQIAHQIHGAIGTTIEYDLQLFTRRLYAWRGTAGSAGWWQDVLGKRLLQAPAELALDIIRAATERVD